MDERDNLQLEITSLKEENKALKKLIIDIANWKWNYGITVLNAVDELNKLLNIAKEKETEWRKVK